MARSLEPLLSNVAIISRASSGLIEMQTVIYSSSGATGEVARVSAMISSLLQMIFMIFSYEDGLNLHKRILETLKAMLSEEPFK